MKCEQELCPFWSGSGCICDVVDIGDTDRRLARDASEGWASYAAEQERHAETTLKLEEAERQIDDHYDAARDRLRERDEALAKLSRSISWSEVDRALRSADAPEDSMATDDDLIRYEGRAEAVAIMRDMLGRK